MNTFPRSAPAAPRARIGAPLLLLGTLALAGALALVAASLRGVPRAHADTQPALTVSVKSGSATATTYTIVATNFPANTALTETFGDGSVIDPASGQTDANGSMTRFWTFNVGNKYCGTMTAATTAVQATVSFWIALSSDPQAGTSCGAGSSSSTATPNATATAAAQASATAAAPTQTPIPVPTSAPASSTGGGLHGLLGNRVLVVVAAGVVALLLIVIVLFVLVSGMRKSGKLPSGSGGRPGAWNGGSTVTSSRMRAQGWQQPMQGGTGYRPHNGPPMGARARAQQGWSEEWPQPAPPTRGRMPGAGQADPRWRLYEGEGRDEPPGKPDPRWSRSQPGSRGGPAEPGPGQSTSSRIRTLRDFTEHRQSVRPPNYDER
jgi:hypothetical protein